VIKARSQALGLPTVSDDIRPEPESPQVCPHADCRWPFFQLTLDLTE
jgi:hypothetical protein